MTIVGLAALSLAACTPSPTPTPVAPKAVTAGGTTCVINGNGSILCHGGNPGDGSTFSADWVSVTGATGAVSVSSGVNTGGNPFQEPLLQGSVCAVVAGGAVKCWGEGYYGQLGNGQSGGYPPGYASAVPVDVVGLSSGAKQVSTNGTQACALTTGGAVKCWGRRSNGVMGDGGSTDGISSTPVDVTGLSSGVQAISVGGNHACALTDTGGVKCWGVNIPAHTHPDDTDIPGVDFGTTPVDVPGATSGITAITAGKNHTCALSDTGGVKCWGMGDAGQLGGGQSTYYTDSATPVDVSGLSSGVVAVSAGGDRSCAVKTDGTVWCWGHPFGPVPFDVSAYLLPLDGSTYQRATATFDVGTSETTCIVTVKGLLTCNLL